MSEEHEVAGNEIPAWFVKIAGAVSVMILTLFAGWMTFVSSQLSSMQSGYVELKANLAAMEKRMEIQLSEENRRYEQIRIDVRTFVDRMETKMDKLLSQRTGSAGP